MQADGRRKGDEERKREIFSALLLRPPPLPSASPLVKWPTRPASAPAPTPPSRGRRIPVFPRQPQYTPCQPFSDKHEP